MSNKNTTSEEFTSYYLQQSTKEFAEDLDKIRGADDFKGDAVAMLVKSLRQGTSLFSAADQKRVLDTRRPGESEKK
ncbi:ribosome-assembly protein 3-domain-containing protein [Hypomontagnella monticulosa]|nr:ribosome-assembly protein 3-domain-containing protein [Hypomontagnella monticulosa]